MKKPPHAGPQRGLLPRLAGQNGRPADIYRANYTLLAVPVEAGEHRVELIFASTSYVHALRKSLTALIGAKIALAVIYTWPWIFRTGETTSQKTSQFQPS